MKPYYDLIVFGENAVDVLYNQDKEIRRPGGGFYSAIAANKLGLSVGLYTTSSNSQERNEFIKSIEQTGIDICGVESKDLCIEYHITNIAELDTQILLNEIHKCPSKINVDIPQEYVETKSVLIYPFNFDDKFIQYIKTVHNNGSKVFIDIQHDLIDLNLITKLSPFIDLAFVSRNEFMRITGAKSDKDIVDKLSSIGIREVIIKLGIGGSIYYNHQGDIIPIPAFSSNYKCTIGAGDVYNAVFISELLKNINITEAGEKSALVASIFIEYIDYINFSDALKSIDFETECKRRKKLYAHPEKLRDINIYLAGNFHSIPMKSFIELISSLLEKKGFSVICPHRDIGILKIDDSYIEKKQCFEEDIRTIANSSLVIALIDNPGRNGVFWEMGYAYCKGIPIITLITDADIPISNMVFISSTTVCTSIHDLVTALFTHYLESGGFNG